VPEGVSAPDDLKAVRESVAALLREGALAVALLEIASESGRLEPRCILEEPAGSSPPPLDTETFATWARQACWRRPGTAHEESPAAPTWGSFFVCPLEVQPALPDGDTLLLVAADESSALEAAVLARRAELAERLSERRRSVLRAVVFTAVDQASDAVEITDRSARMIFVNQAWQRIFGYTSAEALGRFASELIRDKARPVHDASFYRFTEARVAAGQSWLGVLTSSTRGGVPHLNEANVTPFAADPEAFRGNFVVRRDVAHRAERDVALLQAHREFRGFLSAIPDGVAVLRDDLVYFANPALLRLVERDDRAVVGLPFAELIAEDDRDAFLQREPERPIAVRMPAPNGDRRFAEISAAGSISFEGRPASILIARDITERRIAEEQLAHAERLAALGELAAGVAHELNNPMAYVVMNLELVRETLERRGDASTREPLTEALDGIRRMQEIALELRAFAGSDGEGAPDAVALDRAVESAVNIARNQIRHRAVVTRDLEPGLSVRARDGQLVQVLVNLLANAAQAIPDDGARHTVSITTRSVDGGRAEIAVSDTGTGIPAEILPRLFNPFATTKARGQGSGLGLAISRRIVDRFGGEIRAENLPTGGAKVTITLNLAPLPARKSEIPPAPPSERGAHVRVLVIDDETAICRALQRVLARHDVRALNDGHEALTLLLREDFDAIVCDLMMPGISGPKLYAAACEARPSLRKRFIFISGGTLSEDAARFLESCECVVLPKPFSNAMMLAAVHQVASAGSQGR
jgi:PAS domain S-box-containing protein